MAGFHGKFDIKTWSEICDKIEQGRTLFSIAEEYETWESTLSNGYKRIRGQSIKQIRHQAYLEKQRKILERKHRFTQKLVALREEMDLLKATCEPIDENFVMYVLQ